MSETEVVHYTSRASEKVICDETISWWRGVMPSPKNSCLPNKSLVTCKDCLEKLGHSEPVQASDANYAPDAATLQEAYRYNEKREKAWEEGRVVYVGPKAWYVPEFELREALKMTQEELLKKYDTGSSRGEEIIIWVEGCKKGAQLLNDTD